MVINQLKIPADMIKALDRSGKITDDEMKLIRTKACRMINADDGDVKDVVVLRKSIDARKKHNLCLVYNVDVVMKDGDDNARNIFSPYITESGAGQKRPDGSPDADGGVCMRRGGAAGNVAVVGAGPAGLFCTYILALNGVMPVLIEQGSCMEKRIRQTEEFWNDCTKLDAYSNVTFGEGGAGTFSDGKLNTGVKDRTGIISYIKETFVRYGAPEEILYLDKPHIGTDKLRKVITNIRKEIERLGGKVYFDTHMENVCVKDDRVCGIDLFDTANGTRRHMCCDKLVLAIGHSARKTYKMLKNILVMERKDFAVGVRVQHSQEYIDKSQYGRYAEILPHADYKLRYHTGAGRAVYSFCMCPGGYVVNTSTEEGHTVVNGMSNHDRDSGNANSAIVVNVTGGDFEGDDVLAGIEFQRKWERMAYKGAGGRIPVQRFGDYKNNTVTTDVESSGVMTKGAYSCANLREMLPEYVNESIIEAMGHFDGIIKGFADDDIILCGVETRTSAPVRIVRDEGMQANIGGIYPCGEGAGYAGGIMSAAVDGVKTARQILVRNTADDKFRED